MNAPLDQAERDRFRDEIQQNFSVVASAGSGKTRAITDRIVALAKRAPELLPDLVVVTFTNRAADAMQGRARQQILEAGLGGVALAQFNRAFFGTIHSFCLKLLGEHGYRLGLPATLALVTDDDELWSAFVQRQTVIGSSLTPSNRALLLRHVQVRQLMELGRRADIEASGAIKPGSCPELDLSALLSFAADKRSAGKIADIQVVLRDWEAARKGGAEFLPMPRCSSTAKEFVQAWRETFTPLRDWLNCCSLSVATEVQRAYRHFRLEQGTLTYNDQVALAYELLQNPKAAQQIRARNYRVILDEAQDTDPRQFSLLLELTRPPEAREVWPDETIDLPPRPGHFCMVGDFQQSIFGDRADLAHYRRIHEALVDSRTADTLKFSVTFRLDREEIELINRTFADILHGQNDQVSFVELSARPDVLPGQVIRLNLEPPELAGTDHKTPEPQRAKAVAAELARWIANAGLENLRAQSWRDVAILCPRKSWLRTLRDALQDAGLEVQVQSETDLKGDNPAYAWLTALMQVIAQPSLGYEVVGVLREVFGLSDHDLAVFAEGKGERFQIIEETRGSSPVAAKLTLLAQIRRDALRLPLFDAVKTVVDRTHLRERLETLRNAYADLDAELDALLVDAANAEGRQVTLGDFADSLRRNFSSRREVRATDRDAIQLITTQKAKGSEWQAVIVPFLSRAVRDRSPRYPALIRNPATGERLVVLNAEDVTDEVKQAIALADQQEMERMLYVALTRAKHTLVLATEGEIFHSAKGVVQKKSQMKWLRCASGDCHEEAFAKLASDSRECAITRDRQTSGATARANSATTVTALPLLDDKVRGVALKAAARFVRKVNPSGLSETRQAMEEGAENVRTQKTIQLAAFDNSATRYGSWWHGLMERLPWMEAQTAWPTIFDEQLASSPDRERSLREWQLWLAFGNGVNSFHRDLRRSEIVAHTEMPFFWNVDSGTCLEGIIDLALFFPSENRWLLVDWKTNRIKPDGGNELRDRYRPQLAAYSAAVAAITDVRVEAGIYATAIGEFLRYGPDELQDEWKRIRGLPRTELAGIVAVDPV